MSESMGDVLAQGKDSKAQGSKIYGVVIGIVTNLKDPDGLGRVKVKFPWLGDGVESWWARISKLMAGPDRGFCFMPEVDDEVLVAFEHGDVNFPYVLGCLHNGQDKLPAPDKTGVDASYKDNGANYGGPDADGKVQQRYLKTRRGHTIYIDDSDAKSQILLVTSDQKLTFLLDEKNQKMIIQNTNNGDASDPNKGSIQILCPNGEVLIDCTTFKTHSSKDTTILADKKVTITADGDDFTMAATQKNLSAKAGMAMKLESTTDTSHKAGTGMKIEGGTTCDVKGGASLSCKSPMSTFSGDGQCTVKGGMVMIN